MVNLCLFVSWPLFLLTQQKNLLRSISEILILTRLFHEIYSVEQISKLKLNFPVSIR